MCKTENKDMIEKFECFNNRQKDMLLSIIDEMKTKIVKPTFFIGYWEEDCDNFNVVEIPNRESFKNYNKHNYCLNYYWCEYKKDNVDYRITMFYKDFDKHSGNIHILPGAIQVWKRPYYCKDFVSGFCKEDLINKTFNTKRKVKYECRGGKPYCEFGWIPLFETPIFWNKFTKDTIIAKIKKEDYEYETNNETFYSCVSGYSNKGGGTGNYSLLKFDKRYKKDGTKSAYYKTIFVKGLGFFAKYKYNGEKVKIFNINYRENQEENPKGPNHYCLEKERWIIEEKQYEEYS